MLNTIKSIIRRNLFYKIQKFEKKSPILIYSPPKTGTTTINNSLRKAGLANPLYQIHCLSHSQIDRVEKWEIKNTPGGKNKNQSIELSKSVRKMVDKDRHNVNWKIITLTRDPIARSFSSIFQAIETEKYLELVDDNGQLKVDEISRYLQNEIHGFINNSSDNVCWWFDEEIKSVFDIDVCHYQFDHEKGYNIISENNIDILIFRLEDLNYCYNEAISKLLNINQQHGIYESNIRKNKVYSNQYFSIKEKIIIPIELCNKVYSSAYMKHFYSKNEREEFIFKWSGGRL